MRRFQSSRMMDCHNPAHQIAGKAEIASAQRIKIYATCVPKHDHGSDGASRVVAGRVV
jgi:hypothetical protein